MALQTLEIAVVLLVCFQISATPRFTLKVGLILLLVCSSVPVAFLVVTMAPTHPDWGCVLSGAQPAPHIEILPDGTSRREKDIYMTKRRSPVGVHLSTMTSVLVFMAD